MRAARPVQRPGGAYKHPRLQSCAMQFMAPGPIGAPNYNGDWLPYSDLRMIPMVEGAGVEAWEQYLRGRGYGPSSWLRDTANNGYPSWRPIGEACLDWLAGHKLVLLGDSPPASVFQEIKRRSTIGTKVGIYFINHESVNHRAERVAEFNALRVIAKNNLLRSSGVNPNTEHSYIDKYETSDNPPTPPASRYMGSHSDANPPADQPTSLSHTWDVRIDAPGYADAFVGELYTFLTTRYQSAQGLLIDYILIDNVLDFGPFFGFASNAGTISPAFNQANYLNGTREILDKIQVMASLLITQHGVPLRVIGNGGYNAAGVYTGSYSLARLPGRYGEFYLHEDGNSLADNSKTLATLEADFRTHAAALKAQPGSLLMLNHAVQTPAGFWNLPSQWTPVDRWILDPLGPRQRSNGYCGSWRDVRTILGEQGITDRVFVVTSRGSGGFAVFMHPEFEMPIGGSRLVFCP